MIDSTEFGYVRDAAGNLGVSTVASSERLALRALMASCRRESLIERPIRQLQGRGALLATLGRIGVQTYGDLKTDFTALGQYREHVFQDLYM
jgi:hypothetical protein